MDVKDYPITVEGPTYSINYDKQNLVTFYDDDSYEILRIQNDLNTVINPSYDKEKAFSLACAMFFEHTQYLNEEFIKHILTFDKPEL